MYDTELLADQPLGQKLIKKGFWLYFFMLLTAPVGYFIRVIVSNGLPIADVGLFYSIIGLIGLISIYHDLGLTEALQYFLPKYRIEKKYGHYKTVIVLTLVAQVTLGGLIAVGIYFGSDWLAIHHFRSAQAGHIIRLLCWYFIGINFLTVFSSIYMSFQDAIANSLTDFFKYYGIFAFTLIFWLTNTLTVTTFSIAWISGLGIALIASSIIFAKKYGKTLNAGKIIFDKNLVKIQLKYAFWVFLGANVGTLLGQVDQQLVINFLGATSAGYYANYLALIVMYTVIISPVLGMLFPIVSELIHKEKHGELALLQNILYKYFSLFALTIGGLFFALGPEIASILFGVKFAYSGSLLAWSGPFLILHVLFVINYYLLAGMGKVRERVKILGAALLVNVMGNVIFILVLHMGLLGAVLAMMLGWVILFYFSFRVINKHQRVDFDWKFLGKNAIIIIAMSALIFFYKGDFFVLENWGRYRNILYFCLVGVCYYGIIGGVNYINIMALMGEIKKIREKAE